MTKKTGLGQGVQLLFGEEQEKYFECEIDKIVPNKYQPRAHFTAEDLSELADSIKEQGVLQPLLVRDNTNGQFELVAGERRLRASKLAGLKTVPVIRLEISKESKLLEIALIENIQRSDLNAMEEAVAYMNLMEKFQYSQEETARRVGKKRSTIANTIRLLKLPEKIQNDIKTGGISEGHGRALVRLVELPEKLYEVRNAILDKGLSVRQTERLIKKYTSSPRNLEKEKKNVNEEKDISASYKNTLSTQLMNRLNSRVQIINKGNRGKIEIEYYSLDDLDRVTSLLLGEGPEQQ